MDDLPAPCPSGAPQNRARGRKRAGPRARGPAVAGRGVPVTGLVPCLQTLSGAGVPDTVCVVDGNPSHASHVASALMPLYRVEHYSNASPALIAMRASAPAVLMVDVVTPPRDGYAFVRSLRREQAFARLPIIVTSTGNAAGLAASARECGADAAMQKPYRRSVLVAAISSLRNRDIEGAWNALPPLQRDVLNGTVRVFHALADSLATGAPVPFSVMTDACRPLVEAVARNDFKDILAGVRDHDNYTYVHSLRVAALLTMFGQAAGLGVSDQLVLASGGLLHDVGKMAVPHEVLNKPGRLDDAEYAAMKGHVAETVRLLRASPDIPEPVVKIAEQHHEKLDGTGYPHGLAGRHLNELARMAAIVDVFSALTDRRIYKPAMDADEALAVMSDGMKGHLDQHFLSLFKDMLMAAAV